MGSGLDVKIFLLLQAAGVEQGVASSGWCFLPPLAPAADRPRPCEAESDCNPFASVPTPWLPQATCAAHPVVSR